MIAEAHNVAGLHDIISYAVQKGASAIHLCSETAPQSGFWAKYKCSICPLSKTNGPKTSRAAAWRTRISESFLSRGDADLIHIEEFGRFRVNVFKQEKAYQWS